MYIYLFKLRLVLALSKFLLNKFFITGSYSMMSCSVTQFTFVSNNQTWDAAQNYCRSTFTDLATVENEEINQQLIMKNAKSFPFWIGLFNNPWKWSDGGNSTFQNWRDGQPDNWYLSEKCAAFSQANWNDDQCSYQTYFLCYNKSCTPISCTNTYIFVSYLLSWDDAQKYCRAHYTDLVTIENQTMNDQLLIKTQAQYSWIGLRHENDNWHWSNGDNISERYSWINLYMTWKDAQQYCRVNYTDLVSIRDESENMEIMKKAQSNPFWIGLFNDPWKWSDCGQSKFKKWSNQEPNNWSLNEECVEIWPNGTWNDADCSLQKPFICSQSKLIFFIFMFIFM
uniref:C-type lectin domain-containing protein n=1 Tax=Erpetoichthys calabaricus TaxID=27687 RepID=A0A8C4RTZ5_ERPCA